MHKRMLVEIGAASVVAIVSKAGMGRDIYEVMNLTFRKITGYLMAGLA